MLPGNVLHTTDALGRIAKNVVSNQRQLATMLETTSSALIDDSPAMGKALASDAARVRAKGSAPLAATHAQQSLEAMDRLKQGLRPRWPNPAAGGVRGLLQRLV